MQSLSPQELKLRLDAGADLSLIDVREPWEFDICHIPGSCSMPMSRMPACLESLRQDGDIVVICHHGIRSAQVASLLTRSGRHGVFNLTGGIDAWAREIASDMATY
ncbi:MAG TPA: rhodanese-like domain-containing protein [Gammaproteobacteria bacterium]|nr:rhodanese-like domain-containing protein [Gammaproteobacteria bacterium]